MSQCTIFRSEVTLWTWKYKKIPWNHTFWESDQLLSNSRSCLGKTLQMISEQLTFQLLLFIFEFGQVS